jgi:hypothetical protein
LGRFERWVLCGVLIGSFGAIAIYQFSLADIGDTLIGCAFLLVAVVVTWQVNARLLLAYDTQVIAVRNPLRLYVLRRDEVMSAEPDYGGLILRTTSGLKVTVVAVPRPNVALFLNRTSRADRLAEVLMDSSDTQRSR